MASVEIVANVHETYRYEGFRLHYLLTQLNLHIIKQSSNIAPRWAKAIPYQDNKLGVLHCISFYPPCVAR